MKVYKILKKQKQIFLIYYLFIYLFLEMLYHRKAKASNICWACTIGPSGHWWCLDESETCSHLVLLLICLVFSVI